MSDDRSFQLMGIINLTPDSFVSGDRMGALPESELLSRVASMIDSGADILDVGACSTAPGNDVVDAQTEWERMADPVRALFEAFPKAVFSIDSFRFPVIEGVLQIAAGRLENPLRQIIVNDISAGQEDADMLPQVARRGLRYIAMDRTPEPYSFFKEFSAQAYDIGVRDWILDPGFGFGKSVEQNWDILNNLDRFLDFGRPILAALSRKRMIYLPNGLTPDTCAAQSVAAERLAVSKGASIIRTHDLTKH